MWKKIILINLLVFTLLIGVVSAICTDSDGGINYNVKGATKSAYTTGIDRCSGYSLKEYYCNRGVVKYKNYLCPYGCTNGVCKSKYVCGDNIINQLGEQCDNGVNNGILCSPFYGTFCDYCSTSCKLTKVYGSYCGDGVVDSSYETCDDGNNVNGDGCSSACQTEINYDGLCVTNGYFGEQQQEAEQFCSSISSIYDCGYSEFCKWVDLRHCTANGEFGSQQQEIEQFCNSMDIIQSCNDNIEFCKWG